MGVAEDIVNAKLANPGANQMAVNKAQNEGEAKRKPKPKPPTVDDEMNTGMVGVVKDWFKRQKEKAEMAIQGKNYKVPKKGK
jgi:hypothetical protein